MMKFQKNYVEIPVVFRFKPIPFVIETGILLSDSPSGFFSGSLSDSTEYAKELRRCSKNAVIHWHLLFRMLLNAGLRCSRSVP
jgi:hypothetical protein